MKNRKLFWAIVSILIALAIASFYIYHFSSNFWDINYECSADSDCIIRANNYDKVVACNRFDLDCFAWSKVLESGSPGHTVYPNRYEVLAFCNNNKCEVKYDCSKCDILRNELAYCINNNNTGTYFMVCQMYSACKC